LTRQKDRIGFVWRCMRRLNPRIVENYRSGKSARRVLLLTATGRKSGLRRTTPLVYLKIDERLYVAAGRGERADWYRNVQADPYVEIDLGDGHFAALAEPEKDLVVKVAYLQTFLAKQPRIDRKSVV
jgi:deazaflavin-dependent oxidoreductase (nitroreductase family)